MKIRYQASRVQLALMLSVSTLVGTGSVLKAQPPGRPASVEASSLASTMDAQLGMVEREVVGAAEAMPEDKYSFAPAGANFTGVRTFALEVRHLATSNYVLYSAILGQKPPPGVNVDGAANGPDDLRTKQQIVEYLKGSFALGHKGMASLNDENGLQRLQELPIAIPFLNSRLALAIFSFSHASDHYGQMVEYLRMNGINPPASAGQPPANPTGK